jgi:TolB-like protein/Tfp pilus assembly protein PilF
MAVLIATAGFFLFRGRGQAITSIAVMPFSYAGGGGAEMEYLAEGMTESIINNLSQLPRLKKVIARSSVFHYKGKEIIPKAVGQELGVDAVLISRMNQRGDELSISVELVNTLDNSRIWGNQYKKKVSEVFDFQKEISNSIAENLRLKLTGEELKRIGKRYTESPEAYQTYVRGRFFWNKRTEAGLKTAIEYFKQAIEKDPNFALAYAGLADSYCILPQYSSFRPIEAFEKAKVAVSKALELDDTIAEAYAALAWIHAHWDWDWAGAQKEFERAIELNPSYATAHHWYAFLLMFLGQFDESIEQVKHAQELDPLSLIINANVGFIHYYARRYDEAIEYYRKALEMDPNSAEIHWYLGMAYCQKGLYDKALQELQTAIAFSKDLPKYQSSLGYIYVLIGKKDEAVKIVTELEETEGAWYYAAIVYAALGDKDHAFQCLEKSYKEHLTGMPYLKIKPEFDSLRPDPRFKALLKKINLE